MHSVWARPRHFALACLALAAFCGSALFARPAEAGYASIVIDVGSGQVLHEVNADSLNYPASLTKLMTLYLTFGALRDGKLTLATRLPVSGDAASQQPTKINLDEGETVSVQDLILGVVTHSANDAAWVLGEAIGGTEPIFAEMMTRKARRLGMSSTTFQNPNGLPDPDQTTTARDLSRLAIALYRDFPEYYGYFSVPSFTFHGTVYNNFDHLLKTFPGADGLKTGYTHASGYNLATSAEQGGRRLVGVVMGTRSGAERDRLMTELLADAFAGRQSNDAQIADARTRSLEGRIIARALHAVESFSPIATAQAATLPRHGQPLRPPPGRGSEIRAVADRAVGRAAAPRKNGERWAVQVGAVTTRAGRRAVETEIAAPRGRPVRAEAPLPSRTAKTPTVCRGNNCAAAAPPPKPAAPKARRVAS